jgi:hypothetical protein
MPEFLFGGADGQLPDVFAQQSSDFSDGYEEPVAEVVNEEDGGAVRMQPAEGGEVSVSFSLSGTGTGLTSAVSGNMGFNSVSPVERTGTTNNAYQIWVEYTKATD